MSVTVGLGKGAAKARTLATRTRAAPCPPFLGNLALRWWARRCAPLPTPTRSGLGGVSEIERVARRRPLPAFDQGAVGLGQRLPGVAEAVDDRIAAVATEILERDLDAGRRLPALVLGEVEHAGDLHDGLPVEALGDDRGDRLLALD